MHRPLDAYDGISIAEIVLYSLFLIGAVYLSFKHGFKKSAGWRFLVILCIVRLIGASLRLATISDDDNESLYVGWIVTNGLGVSWLIIMLLGLLGRVFDSIGRQGRTVVKSGHQRLIELAMLAAMILLIIGGVNANYVPESDGRPRVDYPAESYAGMGILCGSLVVVILEFVIALFNRSHIEKGENRILIAVGASLPFTAVRLIYSCIVIFGDQPSSPWLYLGAGVIMEIVVVIICQAVGFSLAKAPKKEPVQGENATSGPRAMLQRLRSRSR